MVNTVPSSLPSDRLALLCRLSQTFNASLDLDDVLNQVIDEVITAMKAERGFVMLKEGDGALSFRVARGIDQEELVSSQFQVSRSVVDEVLEGGQAVLTSDARSDDRFSAQHSVISMQLCSILCVPLAIKDMSLGVIYVENRIQAGMFTQGDLELLNAIAANAAIAIENARLYEAAVEKGRMERELQMALTVQQGLLPKDIPQLEGWEFAARWRPAREVSGDYYDFIRLGGPSHSIFNGDPHLGLVIADVTDKGIPAALFMAFTRSIVRASIGQSPSPSDGITLSNRLICEESTRGLFVTLFYAQLNPTTGDVKYVNAGHNPPLLYRAASGSLERLMPTGISLGVVAEASFKQQVVQLDHGDFILLYTDGVTETINPAEEAFGIKRLEDIVHKYKDSAASELAAIVESAVAVFTESEYLFDDTTIVVVKRT